MRAVYVRYFECKYSQNFIHNKRIMAKISTIKERILQFIEYKNISKADFCEKTGISYGNFKGKSSESEIGGDKIAKILSTYGEISADWLILGEGSMIKNEKSHQIMDNISAADQEPANYHNPTPGEMITRHDADLEALRSKIEMLERIIESKDETIRALQERIDSQRHFLDMLSTAHRDIVDRSKKMLEENNRLLNTNNNILNNIASPEYVQQLIVALSISKKGEPATELSAGTGKCPESTEEM